MSATILQNAFFSTSRQEPVSKSLPRIVIAAADQVIHLESRQYVSLRDAVGCIVKPLQGTVWITLDEDSRDIVLKAGESFVVDRPGKTLISAMGEARVCVTRGASGCVSASHSIERRPN